MGFVVPETNTLAVVHATRHAHLALEALET